MEAKALFKELDADGNGFLSRGEMGAFDRPMPFSEGGGPGGGPGSVGELGSSEDEESEDTDAEEERLAREVGKGNEPNSW